MTGSRLLGFSEKALLLVDTPALRMEWLAPRWLFTYRSVPFEFAIAQDEAIVYLLSSCCHQRYVNRGVKQFCEGCETVLPQSYEASGEFVGDWSGAVTDWLCRLVDPLEGLLLAEEFQTFSELFVAAVRDLRAQV